MSQIQFDDTRPAVDVDPGRADVVCFVGLARRAGLGIPVDVRAWLQLQGVLRFPFTPAVGRLTPPMPDHVRSWYLAQRWIQGLVSAAAAPDGTLAAAITPAQTTIRILPALLFAPTTIVLDNEMLRVTARDATGNLTVIRASDGTAMAHALGAPAFFTAIGTIAADLTADDQQLTIADVLDADPPLFVRIGSEIVSIEQIDSSRTRLTVGRGAGGTRAVAHAKDDAIVLVSLDPLAETADYLTNALPASLQSWLQSAGWLTGRTARDLDELFDVPVPIDTHAGFTSLFDSADSSRSAGTDYLAAAVRSFFAQGGQRCYVVRMGDPVAETDVRSDLDAKLNALLVDDHHTSGDPHSWHGVGHLAGLPDVSFLAIPDLPILCASQPPRGLELEPASVLGPVTFTECSLQEPARPQFRMYSPAAPRLAPDDFQRWASSVARILQYLASGTVRQELHLRGVQFVAAFPVPQDAAVSSAPELDASVLLAQDVHDVIAAYLPENVEPLAGIAGRHISSAFLQLTYPWLKTAGSPSLRELLEPPDGALCGLLARNALESGTFQSGTKVTPADISDLWPSLPARDTRLSSFIPNWDGTRQKPLIERISLFGFTPSGLRLLSDVTAYPGEAYRSAAVNRLVSAICRAARRFGETIVFESNGPALWGRVQAFLHQLMTRLWSAHALSGATVKDAFTVRCDRSTMTQNDLDNGTLVAELTFAAAAKIELIRITLAFEAGATSAAEIASVLALAV